MAFKLIIKPIAFADADDGVIYYEKKVAGLGKRFYTIFLHSLSKVQKNHLHFLTQKILFRRCKIEKFPYKIFYFTQLKAI